MPSKTRTLFLLLDAALLLSATVSACSTQSHPQELSMARMDQMPMWGSIFTEEQIWDLVAYLYSFQFDAQK